MAVNSVKIERLLGIINVKLQDDNFTKWSYQFQSVLRGYDLFEFFIGESSCPPKYSMSTETRVTKEITTEYKEWVKKDLALLSLLIATLSDEAMDHVVVCKTSKEAWECLQERFASVSIVRVNQLKSEPHIIQKGTYSVDKYLLKLKGTRDQLVSTREKITDNDFIIVAIYGLPPEFEVIKTVILARDSCISLKDFRAQFLGAERYVESRMINLTSSMSALCVQRESSNAQGGQGYFHNYEQGKSSNSQGFQGFNGGSGYTGNGGKNFHSQQRNNFNSNNKRFYGNNNNSRSFSNFGNRQRHSNGYTDNGKSPQHGSNGANGSFSGNNSSFGNNSSGNSFKQGSNYKSTVSPECQICSRRCHTAPNL